MEEDGRGQHGKGKERERWGLESKSISHVISKGTDGERVRPLLENPTSTAEKRNFLAKEMPPKRGWATFEE